MTEFVRVGSTSEIAPGKVKEVKAGGKVIALCNVGGTFYALDNFCIHRGGPLADGYLDGEKLECPWHGWQFDVKTGCTGGRGMKVETYPIKIEGEDILVGIG